MPNASQTDAPQPSDLAERRRNALLAAFAAAPCMWFAPCAPWLSYTLRSGR
jgi:hypothetical protein